MKTAAELRALLPKTLEQKVEQVLEVCEGFAKVGKTELRTGWDYTYDQDLWIQGGYSRTEEWKLAEQLLRSMGYTVTFYYNEAQFVDMYTKISWGPS